MLELVNILRRNAGSVLTPELIAGIISNYEEALEAPILSSAVSTPPRVLPSSVDPRLELEDQERVAEWVARKIGCSPEWGTYVALGLKNGEGELTAGVVITDITETNASMHVAISNQSALRRIFIRTVFEYVFNELKLERVTGMVDEGNTEALIFDQHLGFEYDHTIKRGNADGDIHMLVMWRDKCRWIGGGKR